MKPQPYTSQPHTNKFAIEALRAEYSDYELNWWHYDRQYLMILRAIERHSLVQVPEWMPKQPKTTTITTNSTNNINDLGRWVFVKPEESTGIEKQKMEIKETNVESSEAQIYDITLADKYEGNSMSLCYTSKIKYTKRDFEKIVKEIIDEALEKIATENSDVKYAPFHELMDIINEKMTKLYNFSPVEYAANYYEDFQDVQEWFKKIRKERL